MSKKKTTQPYLPAAQQELDQKFQHLAQKAYHAEAFEVAELIMRGLKMKAIREIVEHPEMIELKGFKNLEDFLASLGIKKSSGYNMKKIAEAFTEAEFQLLEKMGFSQRGILRLTDIPREQLPDLTDSDDPDELKAAINTLLAENKNLTRAGTHVGKQNEELRSQVKELKARLPNQTDLAWAWLACDRVSSDISDIQSNLNLILDSMDHRLVDNAEFKARVVGLYTMANRMLTEVFDKIDKLTGFHPAREEDGA